LPVVAKVQEKRVRLGTAYLGLSQASIDAAARAAFTRAALLAVLFVLAGAGLGAYLATVAFRPVSLLVEGARAIGQGELSHRIHVSSRDELGELAGAMNQMAESLTAAQAESASRQRMQQELELASRIQASLIPKKHPTASGFSFGMHYRPAREAGGDYFDFIPVSGGKLLLVMADVSGKALRAASAYDSAPDRLLSRLNQLFYGDLPPGAFVSAWAGSLDVTRGVLLHASAGAGNTPVLHFHGAEGTVDAVTFDSPCFPVGMGPTDAFEALLRVRELRFSPGDGLVLFTDGVTEAMNPSRNEYGLPKLLEAVKRGCRLGAQEIVRGVADDVARFSEGAEPHDDMALVVVRAD